MRALFNWRTPTAVTFEEGPLAAWLVRLLTGRAERIIVCNPRYNRLLQSGSKNDRFDAAKLSELLRLGALRPVHHDNSSFPLREMVAHYQTVSLDVARIRLRIKALFRRESIVTRGVTVYGRRGRKQSLRRVRDKAIQRRLAALYRQFDVMRAFYEEARLDMIGEAQRDPLFAMLRSVPFVGEIRAAHLIAYLRRREFRLRHHLWSYAGLSIVTRSSADHTIGAAGKLVARRAMTRGLNRNFQPKLKRVIRDIALAGSLSRGPMGEVFARYTSRGLAPHVARVMLARRITSTIRAIMRDGVRFSAARFTSTTPLPGVGEKRQKGQLPASREARA